MKSSLLLLDTFMNFKEWLKLQEMGTGTGDVAIFARPIFNEPWRRKFIAPWGEKDPFFKKKAVSEAWKMPRWINPDYPPTDDQEEGWELVGSSSNRARTVQAKADGTVK
jgi:hypothetical protein